MSDIKYISPEVKEEILRQADQEAVLRHWHPDLKRSGSALTGKCPSCGSSRFSYTPAKKIIKCFSCNLGANDILGYLQKFQGMKYVDACTWLADHINYTIPVTDALLPAATDRTRPAQARAQHDSLFRDEQLAASGIPRAAQIIRVKDGEHTHELDRYAVGSIDSRFEIVPGHDMLLLYYDLDGTPVQYTPKLARKPRDYFRIRFKHPSAHIDHDGKPTRYMSPPGSSNHIWIPEYIRQRFAAKDTIDTLVFVEGEKKADALCVAGIPAVGIAGIHNFAADNEMPSEITRLITGCGISHVVFWYDADLFELKGDLVRETDFRPRSFAKAALKFRSYMYRLGEDEIALQIWICHGLDTQHKGADDLLLGLRPELSDDHPLAADFRTALKAPTSRGQHVQLYHINTWPDQRIYELWDLHSPKAFMERHAEQLRPLTEFVFKRHRYRWNADKAEFESSQQLLDDERYWYTIKTKYGPQTKFDYLNIVNFLDRRGFYRQRTGLGKYRFIHEDQNVVTEVFPDEIQEFVYEFTRQMGELDVLRMLMQGGTAYFGADKLKNLHFHTPSFATPTRDRQVLVFKDTFWLVTPERITVHKHRDLPGKVWSQEVIDFSPTYIPDFITMRHTPTDAFMPIEVQCAAEDSDIFRYIKATSDIHWRDARATETGFPDSLDKFSEKDLTRMQTLMACILDKIIATGYTVSGFFDKGEMKAVVCMDAHESRSGKSEGGTGKSLWASMFEHLFSVHKINGKQARLTEDQFLYDGVDERTRLILIDDCRRTTDFEAFFSFITGGVMSNTKGLSKFWAGLKRWILTTNFSIRGEDRSHLRRQYIITFSDYFNMERDPYSIFGHSLFDEWDDKQWNYWYNFIASSLQILMRTRLRSFAPDEDIRRRRLRDTMSETWLETFERYFYPESEYMNKRLDIDKFLEAFVRKNPSQKPWATKSVFKDKVDLFCKYAGYGYNVPKGGDRIRNGSKGLEYFVISDENFNMEAYQANIDLSNHVPTETPEF